MKSTVRVLFFFLIITLIAYLPFTSFLFALKNDAFTGYFPPKFFMSESIHAGYLPLWNPYINYGLPQYGDMSGGFWSPVTWLVASIFGYNVYSFTLEEAFYIFMSGLGMYHLTSYWKMMHKVRLMAGLAYMCSGYMVGHLQHFNWISGAAFLPWCLFTYLIVLRKVSVPGLLKLALSCSLFFSSAHPGIIIGAVYLFAMVAVSHFYNKLSKERQPLKLLGEMASQQALFLGVILLFIAGPVAGYLEVLPHISRAERLPADVIAEPATIQSWISVLLPFSITKNGQFFATDISIRNSYFGLVFLLMFLIGLAGKKTKWQQLLLASAAFFFLLSVGGIFKHFAISYLPLIGYVRLSGEFRIFTLFSIILFAAIQLNKIIKGEIQLSLRPYYYFLLALLGCALLYAVLEIAARHQSILVNPLQTAGDWRQQLKMIIDHLTFQDTLLIQGMLQVIFLTIIVYALMKKHHLLLLRVVVAEMILVSLFNIPFTGVGKASAKEVERILNQSPRGIPVPPLQPTVNNTSLPVHETKMVGDWSFYSKQIGTIYQVPYPINLNNTDLFFKNADRSKLDRRSYIYLPDENPGKAANFQVTRFTPNKISIKVNTVAPDTIVYKQNYYPCWSATVNNHPVPIVASAYTFLAVPVTGGEQHVSFRFSNNKIVVLIFTNLLLFFGGCVSLIIYHSRRQC